MDGRTGAIQFYILGLLHFLERHNVYLNLHAEHQQGLKYMVDGWVAHFTLHSKSSIILIACLEFPFLGMHGIFLILTYLKYWKLYLFFNIC